MKKIITYFWTYKLINTIKYLFVYLNHKIKIGDVFYSDSFKMLMKRYINIDLSKDWLGRLYGVINPNIDINGNFDVNNMIIEINGDATNNLEQIKVWTYRQLSLVGELFRLHGLYDMIDVEFKHVGPINGDNYLLIFDIASRQRFTYFLKRLLGQTILYISIACAAYAIMHYAI